MNPEEQPPVGDACRMQQQPRKSVKASTRAMLPPPPPPLPHSSSAVGMECSMCGDVGFQKELFRCVACRQRFQHRYCSSFYPNLPKENEWICDWCLLKDNKPADLLSNHPRPRQTITHGPPTRSPKSPMSPSLNSPKQQQQQQPPSPLDFLLEVAELESCSKKSSPSSSPSLGKSGRIRRVMSMPTSVKKFDHNMENDASNVRSNTMVAPSSPKIVCSSPGSSGSPRIIVKGTSMAAGHELLKNGNKRKRCSEVSAKDEVRRPPPLLPPRPHHSKPPFSPSSPSPSKVAARRYKLLSEVC